MSTRRQFLATAAAFSVVPLASAGAKSQQVVGMYRHGVGDITVTALLDGFLELDPGMLNGSDASTNERLLKQAFLANGPVETAINAYVIETADQTILVDGGAGSAMGETAGNLPKVLEAAGFAAKDIGTIFCTHLHPDHIGAFASDGKPAFANAEFKVNAVEHDFWTDDSNFKNAGEMAQNFASMAQGVVKAYADNCTLIGHGDTIAQGITAHHLPGHTPGHTGLMLSSGERELMIWADIVHVGPIQFAKPSVTIPFDVNPDQAAQTRAKVMDQVSGDRLEIAGSHIAFPSFGHVVKGSEGYEFEPSRWDYKL